MDAYHNMSITGYNQQSEETQRQRAKHGTKQDGGGQD